MSRLSCTLWMLVLSGCGNVAAHNPDAAVDPDAPATDAAATDAPPRDAAPPRCNPQAPFGPAMPELSLNGFSSEGAALSTDELTVWFSASNAGTPADYDIYQASRADAADPFSNIHPVAHVNTTTDPERGPHLTADRRRLYATLGGGATFHLRMAVRNIDGTYAPLQPIPGVGDPADKAREGGPYPVTSTFEPQSAVLYYHSNVSGVSRIYRITDSGSGFHDPTPVDIIGVPAGDPGNAVVTPDERTLYFSIAGDIWTATRAKPPDAFHDPTVLSSLSTSGLDGPTWISDDNCVLYLTQQANTSGPLAYKIYVARRPK